MPDKAITCYGSESSTDKLNALSIAELIGLLGAPSERVNYVSVPGWSEGDGRPAVADDDPATMQAIGRCAANRVRSELPEMALLAHRAHPSTCGWCDYPLDMLLAACSWSVHQSGLVGQQILAWSDNCEKPHDYLRAGTEGGFRNRRYREFWALPGNERERRIEAASGRKAAA